MSVIGAPLREQPEASRAHREERRDSLARANAAHASPKAEVVRLSLSTVAELVHHPLGALGKRCLDPRLEDLVDHPGEAEQDKARGLGSGLMSRLKELRDLRIRQARDDRRDVDPHAKPRLTQASNRLQATSWAWDIRLKRPAHLWVHEGDADGHRAGSSAIKLREQLYVPLNQGRLGDDADRVPVVSAEPQGSSASAHSWFKRLIAIRVAREEDGLAPPTGAIKGLTQAGRRPRFDHDRALKVGPCSEVKVW